jgi:intracellular sulfur oxidation DsrE/DsrF family protein
MKRRTGIVIAIGAIALATGAAKAWTAYRPLHLGTPSDVKAMVFQPYDEQKVVYHLTQRPGFRDGAYRSALTQIASHMAAVSEGFIEVKVILQGEGVNLLASAQENPEIARQIDRLKGRGVTFLVCQNTVITHDIDPKRELYGYKATDMVPYSMAEIAALVQKGFVYVKL